MRYVVDRHGEPHLTRIAWSCRARVVCMFESLAFLSRENWSAPENTTKTSQSRKIPSKYCDVNWK
jgi:hypothetical protein